MEKHFSDSVTKRANQFLRVLFLVTIAVSIGMTFRAYLSPPAHAVLSADFVFWGLLTLVTVALTWGSFFLRRTQTPHHLTWQLLMLIGVWGWAVLLLGGAMSSANAIQLILVALLFLVLPLRHALILLFFIFAFQILYIFQLLSEFSQHDQHQHFMGMSASFLISAVILALVTYSLRIALERNEQKIAALREEQLRQEQVLAVATATAQMSHELATPLSTLKLWLDELDEAQSHDLKPIRPPIERMSNLLDDLRQTAVNIQQNKQTLKSIREIEQELTALIILQYPEYPIQWELSQSEHALEVDATLTSALLNLIRNAIQHSQNLVQPSPPVQVRSGVTENHWQLVIRNAFSGEQPNLATLGVHIQPSQHGLGIGTLLSHATLERFNGRLSLSANNNVVEQRVELPLHAAKTMETR